jgi:hypothetical protein
LSFLARNCFPRIVNLRIERWQAARLGHTQADGFLKELLYCSVSRELQSLDIFEDRSSNLEINDRYSPTSDLAVSGALWRVCHMFPKLQSFSACSIIDASDFFSHFSDSFAEIRPWPELKTLCLTSKHLMRSTWPASFHIEQEQDTWKLLTNATKVANLMPKLEVLELWYAERNVACIWTYYKTESRARFIVRGGQSYAAMHQQPHSVRRLRDMAKIWAKYASELLNRTITCEVLVLPFGLSNYDMVDFDETTYSPCDIVQHLELARVILHPTTLHQMKWDSSREPHHGGFRPLFPWQVYPEKKKAEDASTHREGGEADTGHLGLWVDSIPEVTDSDE